MNGHHCIWRFFFKYHEFCPRTINLLTVEQKYAAPQLDQVYHNTILEPSSSIWVCDFFNKLGAPKIYPFLQKTEGIFQKTKPWSSEKKLFEVKTPFLSYNLQFFVWKNPPLQGKNHKGPTCGSLGFRWLRFRFRGKTPEHQGHHPGSRQELPNVARPRCTSVYTCRYNPVTRRFSRRF